MRLLLINPNTSRHITGRTAASVHSALGSDDPLTAVTAVSSPRVVRSATDLLQVDANIGAVLPGISLDVAAVQLRERYPAVPTAGMTEAALHDCMTA